MWNVRRAPLHTPRWSRVLGLGAIALSWGCPDASWPRPNPPPVIEVEGSSQTLEEVPVGAVEPADPKKDGCIEDLLTASHLTAPSVDRELFSRALSARHSGHTQRLREHLYELVDKHRPSPLVPHSYLLFAESFAAEASSDPSKWPIATSFYREATKYPFPAFRAALLATLRWAESDTAAGNPTEGLLQHRTVLSAHRSQPDAPCIDTLAARARQGAIACYAEVGSPSKAHAFFASVLVDPLPTLVELARRYAAQGNTQAATTVIDDIAQRVPNLAICAELRELALEHSLSANLSSACP